MVTIDNILRYWRASLADGMLGKGTFRQRDREHLVSLSEEVLRSGVLPLEIVDRIFSGRENKDAKSVLVRLWPRIAARNISHATAVSDGLPELVASVVTEAAVMRDGTITPGRNAVPRDILTPLTQGSFAIGSVEDLDGFLVNTPLAMKDDGKTWPQYLSHCGWMVDDVVRGWPQGDDNYIPLGTGFLEVMNSAAATVRQILDLYDLLLKESPDTPLLSRYALAEPQASGGVKDIASTFALRAGHSNNTFPLADQQRDALSCLATSSPGEVIAVNGPPGTGKTTMILSAVASAWVRAAAVGQMPPVIVAASTNNQAVTNVIDAFGKDFARGEGPLAGRWLPDIDSFGMFLAAKTREKEASKLYITENFFEKLENEDYVPRAREYYLTAARKALPHLINSDVKSVVEALHGVILDGVASLEDAERAHETLGACQTSVAEKLGQNPEKERERLHTVHEQCCHEQVRRNDTVTIWERYQAAESILLVLFGFLLPVARKRALKARLALEDAGCGADLSGCNSMAAIDVQLRTDAKAATAASRAARVGLEHAENLLAELDRAHDDRDKAVAALGADPGLCTDARELDRFADCGIRFRLFLMATHYWEGRWLMAMEDDLLTIVKSRRKKGRLTVLPRWQRRMMLTPCAVSTFATLPGKMIFKQFLEGNFETKYLLNFIDLLIVDEAGQVLPEVAAASFALAKQALVIGDTQQIEPISNVPWPVDVGNLRDCGLIPTDCSEQDLEAVSARGLRSVDGSAMRLAQEACGIAPYPELEKGLYLFEHRRCHDEIIGYCNALCYKGALQPMRGGAPDNAVLPAIGYLHIDGICAMRSGGSRSNATEAQTIASWLEANRAKIEVEYGGTKLEQIVGVVTPFGRQVHELREACRARGISVDGRNGMTIGTVHSLQGAERPVVIFSPVYSKHADGHFIDRSPSMLNVTVSRARDSFLVFGDMDVFSTAAAGSPRAVLAPFLFMCEENELQFPARPRSDLQPDTEQPVILRDAQEHDAFLLGTLGSEGQRYVIVSPWIVVATMKQTGILDAFRSAIARGAEIDIYSDPVLNGARNDGEASSLDAAEVVFSDIGVRLHRADQLHSKFVAMDSDLFCIGSYNWLSAARQGRYARHETSVVYRGGHLQREIEVLIESLTARDKRVAPH